MTQLVFGNPEHIELAREGSKRAEAQDKETSVEMTYTAYCRNCDNCSGDFQSAYSESAAVELITEEDEEGNMRCSKCFYKFMI